MSAVPVTYFTIVRKEHERFNGRLQLLVEVLEADGSSELYDFGVLSNLDEVEDIPPYYKVACREACNVIIRFEYEDIYSRYMGFAVTYSYDNDGYNSITVPETVNISTSIPNMGKGRIGSR